MFLWQQKFQHVPHCRIQPIWRYYFYKVTVIFFFHNLTLSNSACFLLNIIQWKNVKNLLLQERERLFDLLKGIPFLKPFPSHSNFILCEVTSGKDAKKIKVCFPCYYTFLISILFHWDIIVTSIVILRSENDQNWNMKISHLCFSFQTTIGCLEKNILYLCSHFLWNAQMIETVWNVQYCWCASINNKNFRKTLQRWVWWSATMTRRNWRGIFVFRLGNLSTLMH